MDRRHLLLLAALLGPGCHKEPAPARKGPSAAEAMGAAPARPSEEPVPVLAPEARMVLSQATDVELALGNGVATEFKPADPATAGKLLVILAGAGTLTAQENRTSRFACPIEATAIYRVMSPMGHVEVMVDLRCPRYWVSVYPRGGGQEQHANEVSKGLAEITALIREAAPEPYAHYSQAAPPR